MQVMQANSLIKTVNTVFILILPIHASCGRHLCAVANARGRSSSVIPQSKHLSAALPRSGVSRSTSQYLPLLPAEHSPEVVRKRS